MEQAPPSTLMLQMDEAFDAIFQPRETAAEREERQRRKPEAVKRLYR